MHFSINIWKDHKYFNYKVCLQQYCADFFFTFRTLDRLVSRNCEVYSIHIYLSHYRKVCLEYEWVNLFSPSHLEGNLVAAFLTSFVGHHDHGGAGPGPLGVDDLKGHEVLGVGGQRVYDVPRKEWYRNEHLKILISPIFEMYNIEIQGRWELQRKIILQLFIHLSCLISPKRWRLISISKEYWGYPDAVWKFLLMHF